MVDPLYLAGTLRANLSGRGTAIFQFMRASGIVMASPVGFYYTHHAEIAIAQTADNPHPA